MSGTLLENVAALMGRELTVDEVRNITTFQRLNEIDDSDPLIVLISYLSRNTLILDQLPEQMKLMVKETIELHRTVLREQSILISKDMFTSIALSLEKFGKYRKFDLFSHMAAFTAGSILAAIIVILLRHL